MLSRIYNKNFQVPSAMFKFYYNINKFFFVQKMKILLDQKIKKKSFKL